MNLQAGVEQLDAIERLFRASVPKGGPKIARTRLASATAAIGEALRLARIAARGTTLDWLLAHVDHAGDECLPWPFAQNAGYGWVSVDGKRTYAHIVMCQKVHGPAPSPVHQASRSCSDRTVACVNPRHLQWKTPTQLRLEEGAARRAEIAGAGPYVKKRWKLRRDHVEKIRALKGKKTQTAVGRMFGVQRQTVSMIWRGEIWSCGARSPEQARFFAAMEAAGRPMTMRDLKAASGLNGNTLHTITRKLTETGEIERIGKAWRLPFTPERSRQIFDAVGAAISKGLPPQMRDDVRQDVALQIIEGEVALGDIRATVAAAIKRYHKLHPSKYGPASLDAALPGTEGMTLHDKLIGHDGRDLYN